MWLGHARPYIQNYAKRDCTSFAPFRRKSRFSVRRVIRCDFTQADVVMEFNISSRVPSAYACFRDSLGAMKRGRRGGFLFADDETELVIKNLLAPCGSSDRVYRSNSCPWKVLGFPDWEPPSRLSSIEFAGC